MLDSPPKDQAPSTLTELFALLHDQSICLPSRRGAAADVDQRPRLIMEVNSQPVEGMYDLYVEHAERQTAICVAEPGCAGSTIYVPFEEERGTQYSDFLYVVTWRNKDDHDNHIQNTDVEVRYDTCVSFPRISFYESVVPQDKRISSMHQLNTTREGGKTLMVETKFNFAQAVNTDVLTQMLTLIAERARAFEGNIGFEVCVAVETEGAPELIVFEEYRMERDFAAFRQTDAGMNLARLSTLVEGGEANETRWQCVRSFRK